MNLDVRQHMMTCWGLTSRWLRYMTRCIREPPEARQQISCLNSFKKNVIQELLLLEASGSKPGRWDHFLRRTFSSHWQSRDTGFISAWIFGLVRVSNFSLQLKNRLGQCFSLLSVASTQRVAQTKSNSCCSFVWIPELNLALLARGVVWWSMFGVGGS